MRRYLFPALGLLLVGAMVFLSTRADSSTPPRPASVAPRAQRIRAEGRLAAYPGAQVVLGLDRGGTLKHLYVDEKSVVKKGQLIAELDAGEERAALAEAQARIAEAEADLALGERERERFDRLHASGAAAPSALDHATHDRDGARARRDLATATAHRLEATLRHTRLLAPIDGVVIARHAQQGEPLAAGAPVVTIADLARTRVEAEVDEFDAGRLAIGAKVAVSAEGYGAEHWAGTIEEIPDAVGPRRLKPADPGRPSDTRVLVVKVALAGPTPLKLGQRVELEIAALR